MLDHQRRQYLAISQLASHRRRVDEARAVLRDAAARGPLVVSTSWGKDSIVLCDLAIETLGRVPLMHLASPYELPCYAEVRAHFGARTEVHEVPPARTLAEYVEWCREIGLPHERTQAAQAGAVQSLKKDRGRAWCDDHGFRAQALGMRADESRGRRANFRLRGLAYEVEGLVIACPLAWWSARDVWAHIVARGLPYPDLYDRETHGHQRETIRNTGWLSTDGADSGRLAWLRQHYPEQFRALAAEFPQVRRLA